MSHTDYLQWTSGVDLYAKPLPLVDPTWNADIISGVENGTLGSYAFAALDDTTEYNVYVAAAGVGNEANTDLAIGILQKLATVTVTPVQGVIPPAVSGSMITIFTNETKTISIAVVDQAGDPVDVSGMTLTFVIEDKSGADKVVIADGSITKVTSTISFAVPAAASADVGDWIWSLRQATANEVIMWGTWSVKYAPEDDV